MDRTINTEERRTLLSHAREAITAKLEGRPPAYRWDDAVRAAFDAGTSALAVPCGAFVTLHTARAGLPPRLRGCIGRLRADSPLEETVRTMAVEAAWGDRRFPPLTREAFESCRIEISVLSPLERCGDPRLVTVGLHGLYLVHRGRAGVLLPQVPVQQGWDREAYLEYLGVKAGLPPGSCDAPGAELFTFTAVVFGE